ncbi:heterokaryon incompatibility protein-domain-containing protein [Podospora aff. communis PSN243]|uniref:Heterokaryon incompatibility protein-domain-containing protein n=1 Tax=Podospora aff. communis PSN243 TaxID=3040156 RepID=A0AAV9G6K0_9PEZI|nr:heterokaryon incompatibility protein-domain-containing protein [Podospora aff. communis PSN243]
MPKCATCYDLDRAKLSRSPAGTQFSRDCWILDKSLAELEKAAQSGCSVCDVLSFGLRARISGQEGDQLDAPGIRVEIKIPLARYNRIRLVASRCPKDGGRVLADLKLYGSSKSSAPWSEYQCGNVVPSGADFSSYVSIIRSWLESCTKHCCQPHSSCQPSPLPTRILNLNGGSDGKTIHVIETRSTDPAPYIALSYCWGNGSLPKTNKDTSLPQSHLVTSLPPSFQDAIRLTRALGIRYLWIDSLCIFQDSRSDWEFESSQMLQYYSGAFLVLAASRAASPAHGFLRSREPCEMVRPRHSAVAAGNGVIFRRFSQHLAFDLNRHTASCAPLDTRAWAMQERLSAGRVVHFYDDEMVWECKGATWCECGKFSESNHLLENGESSLRMRVSQAVTAGVKSRGEGFRAWADLVEHYTRRDLTQDADRLPAIGGLARMFSSGGKLGRYVAGIWEGALWRCLLWRVEGPKPARRPTTYVAPSWSWAGLVGQVNWKCVAEYRLEIVAQILDCRTTCTGSDAFGQVKDGMLRIRARTWETQAEYRPACGFMALTSGETAYFDVNGECKRNTRRSYRTVKCVILAEGKSAPSAASSVLLALVVEETTRLDVDVPRYERIGLAILDQRRFGGSVEETVVVI